MAFVAMGFDHVVANMFFLPGRDLRQRRRHHWVDALHNWLFAFVGNLVGAAMFVAGAYYYLYGRGQDDEQDQGAGDTERTGRFDGDGNGDRITGERTTARSGA